LEKNYEKIRLSNPLVDFNFLPENEKQIWYEMARRKVQFHKNEDWKDIRLWGLFKWNEISHLLEKGQLITWMKKEHKTVWVRPTLETWNVYILPLILKYDSDVTALSRLAGWDI